MAKSLAHMKLICFPSRAGAAVWFTTLLVLLAGPAGAVGPDLLSADKIFLHGGVITMDAQKDIVEAVAVRAGKILLAGTETEVKKLAGPKTQIIDLHGGVLLPGFYAAHDHFPSVGMEKLYDVNLNSPPMGKIRNIPDIIAALRVKAVQTPAGQWIEGDEYDDTLLAEKRHPTRYDLDQVSTNHPIWIVHTSGHLAVANSLALQLAGITRDTPQPAGGVIRKDPVTGEPTGVIEERLGLISVHIPAETTEQHLKAIQVCDREYLSQGVTTTVIAGTSASVVRDLVEALSASLLHLRIHVMLVGGPSVPDTVAEAKRLSPDPDRINLGTVKLFQDGSLQGYTGFLTEPYYRQRPGHTNDCGYARRSRAALVDLVKKYHRAGYQVAIHGNGDAAIDDILAAYAAAQQDLPNPDSRDRIEHSQTARPDQLLRMKQLGVTPSFFVAHVYYWGDRHRDIFLGPERAAHISPLATALADGLHFTLHNDTPVTPVNPLQLVWSAVNRVTTSGQVLGPDERIGAYDALRAVTADAAWQNFEEAKKGTIEPGKFADFVVLAENPLTVPPMHIKDIRIVETIVGGDIVYQAN